MLYDCTAFGLTPEKRRKCKHFSFMLFKKIQFLKEILNYSKRRGPKFI